MAKFQTKVKADLNHLMEYVHNSLRPDNLPAMFIDSETREYGDVKIILKRYAVNTPTIVIFTIKADSQYINVDIINTGVFTPRATVEDGGQAYTQYLDNVFHAYNPQTPAGTENRYIAPPKNNNHRIFKEPTGGLISKMLWAFFRFFRH